MVAVMAKYKPFAEKAGMQKIAEYQSVESVLRVSGVLLELGFDLQLIGSERYVKGILGRIDQKQASSVHESLQFVGINHLTGRLITL